VLDDRLARAEIGRNERGLPLICRAGPAGAAPGGDGFSEIGFTPMGLHARPWSPASLKIEAVGGGVKVIWTARPRLYGDSWDGEPAPADPLRFRVAVRDGTALRRMMEVEGNTVLYAAEDMAADFPGGVTPAARIAVAQWGEGFGWGVEAEIALA